MIQAIWDRRSVRRYLDRPVSREQIEAVLRAGTLAPSAKNRQPWQFVVVTGPSKEELLQAMERGLARERAEPLLPESARFLQGAASTAEILRQAPAVILVLCPLGLELDRPLTPEERVYEICNAQSVGAAMENMSLAATEAGLGSLWICDTYFAYPELREWLGLEGALFGALALGYADEMPPARPRKRVEDITVWRT